MIRFLLIALLVYLVLRMLKGDILGRFRPASPKPELNAVETVQCAKCGMYVAVGAKVTCDVAGCPYTGR